MTMPHLMNCRHDDSGWCIPCVKKLHDEMEMESIAKDRLIMELEGVARAMLVYKSQEAEAALWQLVFMEK